MSAQHNMTGREICAVYGMKEDTARQRNNTRLTGKWSLNRVYSDSEISVLLEGKPKSEPKQKAKSLPAKTENRSEKQEEKKPKTEPKTGEAKTVFYLSISITVISIFLTITGLFVFANWAGAMLGSMFSLFLFAAVWIARNKMKGLTSEQALGTVWKLESGAAVLHFFTFWRLLEIRDEYFKAAACLFLAGFVAYLSYNAVLTVRDYNAET